MLVLILSVFLVSAGLTVAEIKPDYIVVTEGGGVMLNRPRLFSDEQIDYLPIRAQFPITGITDNYVAGIDEWVRVAYPVTDGKKYTYQIVSDGRSVLQVRIPENKYDKNWERFLVVAIKDYETKTLFYQKKRAEEKRQEEIRLLSKTETEQKRNQFQLPCDDVIGASKVDAPRVEIFYGDKSQKFQEYIEDYWYWINTLGGTPDDGGKGDFIVKKDNLTLKIPFSNSDTKNMKTDEDIKSFIKKKIGEFQKRQSSSISPPKKTSWLGKLGKLLGL